MSTSGFETCLKAQDERGPPGNGRLLEADLPGPISWRADLEI